MSTPYMNLNLPIVGPLGTQGPDWATDINTALDLIDSHDHSPGKGKQLTLSSLIVNQPLQMNSFGITQIASLALDNLGTQPTDANLIYEYNGELFFNDASANQVQLTSGGAINVSSLGAITGDYSTSSADLTYSDTTKTFSFYQSTGVYASVDQGPLKIYQNIPSSPYFVIKQSSSQTGNLDWTLPSSYPASTLPLKVSPAGELSTGQIQTVEIGDGQITAPKMAVDSVDTTNIKDGSVTRQKFAPLAQQISSPVASYTNGTFSDITVPSLTVTLTTTGRPVVIGFSSGAIFGYGRAVITIVENGTTAVTATEFGLVSSVGELVYYGVGAFTTLYAPSAGTYTYTVNARCVSGGSFNQINIQNTKLFAYELY